MTPADLAEGRRLWVVLESARVGWSDAAWVAARDAWYTWTVKHADYLIEAAEEKEKNDGK